MLLSQMMYDTAYCVGTESSAIYYKVIQSVGLIFGGAGDILIPILIPIWLTKRRETIKVNSIKQLKQVCSDTCHFNELN